MADQCIVCLEILDSAEPLQQLQGDDDGGGGSGSGPGGGASPAADLGAPTPLALAATAATAAASPTISTTTTTTTTTATKDLFELGLAASLDCNDKIAKIEICGHVLHDSCLREWTVKANSCPFCRQAFHQVEVYDKIGGESLFSTNTVPFNSPQSAYYQTVGLILRNSNRNPLNHIQSRRQETSRRIRSPRVAGRKSRR